MTKEENIVLNVKVYRLAFSDKPEYNSTVTDASVTALFASVNAVWTCAGICWKLLPLQRLTINARDAVGLAAISEKPALRELFEQISPIMPRVLVHRIWNVCLLDHFPVRSGGVYLPKTKAVFFAEASRHHQPNAVTLAHELGHMLGLRHVQDEANLMNPDSLRTLQNTLHAQAAVDVHVLTGEQIAAARNQAKSGPYGETYGETNPD